MDTRKSLRLGTAALFLTTCLLPSTHLIAGGRQRAVAVSPPSSDLSITFVDAGPATAGVIDAGTIAARPRRGKQGSAVTTRTFAMRIGQASREARGAATVRAFLETPDPNCTIRIDGIVLGATPRVVRRNAPVGITTIYRLEIEVPASAPPGGLASTIGWEVTTD
jgi:hypothetical protein